MSRRQVFTKIVSMMGIFLMSAMISASSHAAPAAAGNDLCQSTLQALHPEEANGQVPLVLLSESVYPAPKSMGATIAITEGTLCIFKGNFYNPKAQGKEAFYRVIHLVQHAYNNENNDSQDSHIEDVRWEANVNAGNPNPAIRAVSQKIHEDELTLFLEKQFENGLTIRYVVEKHATALAYASASYKLFGFVPRLNVIHNDEYLIR